MMHHTAPLGPDATVPRDRWGRPLIVPPEGGDPVPYARASSLGKALSDDSALSAWKARSAARGVATSPAIAAAIATTDPDDRKALDDLVAQALARVGTGDAATLGTAIHAACEAHDLGQPLSGLPLDVRHAVERYARLLDAYGLEPLPAWAEVFLAHDDLLAAGSADRFYRLRDGRVVVGDLKTGRASAADYAGLEWSTQLSVYAGGVPYRHPGVRGHRHPNLDPTVGVVVHVPSDGGPSAVHDLDLVIGARLATLASQVRSARRLRPLATRPAVHA